MLACSTTSPSSRPPSASSSRLFSMTNPRVMISGTPSSEPVCLLIATTHTTSPSSARWRRSRRTSSATSPVRVKVPDIAVFGQQDVRLRIAAGEHAAGHARVLRELAKLAVNGNEVPGSHERQHELQLFLAAVPGHMDVLDTFVNHLCA